MSKAIQEIMKLVLRYDSTGVICQWMFHVILFFQKTALYEIRISSVVGGKLILNVFDIYVVSSWYLPKFPFSANTSPYRTQLDCICF